MDDDDSRSSVTRARRLYTITRVSFFIFSCETLVQTIERHSIDISVNGCGECFGKSPLL